MGEQEEKYTRLALILDENMDIMKREKIAAGGAPNNGNKIYIRKNVNIPEKLEDVNNVDTFNVDTFNADTFNADTLSKSLSASGGDKKNILTVYLDKDLKVHTSTVTDYVVSYFDNELDFEVKFNEKDMYKTISSNEDKPNKYSVELLDGGCMKLNKKPKKKTKNGTYKKQVNKTK